MEEETEAKTKQDITYNITTASDSATQGKTIKLCKSNKTIEWTIPCFPVININFEVVEIEAGDVKYGLIKMSDAKRITSKPMTVICFSHCVIEIDEITYLVLWEWRSECYPQQGNAIHATGIQDETEIEITENNADHDYLSMMENLNNDNSHDQSETEDEDSEEDESPQDCEHELPFKVMGVTHVPMRQTHLMMAHDKLESGNADEVRVRITGDPNNPYDPNAIAVEIEYGKGWNVVGFILKDLTKFVHPALRTNKILQQRIGHIRFRTHWSSPGYYMTLFLKRQGMWPNEVVRASKRVR